MIRALPHVLTVLHHSPRSGLVLLLFMFAGGVAHWAKSPKSSNDGDEQPAQAVPYAEPAEGQLTSSNGMTFVWIRAGEFMMGPSAYEEGRMPDETRHRVRITRAFYLSAFEVTVRQFRQFAEETGYRTDLEILRSADSSGATGRKEFTPGPTWRDPEFPQGDDHPVVCVSWNDAVAFCRWLSEKEGRDYRLPTEAEWEYACRAGTTTSFSCGDSVAELNEVANVVPLIPKANGGVELGKRAYPCTSPVGAFPPNAFGLYDMHGNAAEWCADWYAAYGGETPQDDPHGPDAGRYRIIRGGSYGLSAHFARSAHRTHGVPVCGNIWTGFRLARSD